MTTPYLTVNGRAVHIDLAGLQRSPIDLTRDQVDQGQTTGEQTLNQRYVWRRVGRDFSLGSGQEDFDDPDESNRRQYRFSKGINPWDKGKLSLLNDTESVYVTTDGGTRINQLLGYTEKANLVSGGDFIYMGGGFPTGPLGAQLYYSSNKGSTWAQFNPIGTSGGSIDGILLFNDLVYLVMSQNIFKVLRYNAGAQTPTPPNQWTTTDATMIDLVAGRFIVGNRSDIYEVNSSGVVIGTNPHFSHFNSQFRFKGAVESPAGGIYLYGNNEEIQFTTPPGTSEIFFMSAANDGSLNQPIAAAPRLVNEPIYNMIAVGGVMVMGTQSGIRVCQVRDDGGLVIGPLISEPGTVKDLIHFSEGGRTYVLFTWSNPFKDGNHVGIGRLDLSKFTEPLVPAYATDIFYNDVGAGAAEGVAILDESPQAPMFVYADGEEYRIVKADTDKFVSVGQYRSGFISFGLLEDKRPVRAMLLNSDVPTGTSVELFVDDPNAADTSTALIDHGPTDGFRSEAIIADTYIDKKSEFEIRLELDSNVGGTLGPTANDWGLEATPVPDSRTELLVVPVVLHRTLNVEAQGLEEVVSLDPKTEFDFLFDLQKSRKVVPIVFGLGAQAETRQGWVDAFGVAPGDDQGLQRWGGGHDDWPEGTWVLQLVLIA